jgi:Ca2+-binding EF-hand superfamily protein
MSVMGSPRAHTSRLAAIFNGPPGFAETLNNSPTSTLAPNISATAFSPRLHSKPSAMGSPAASPRSEGAERIAHYQQRERLREFMQTCAGPNGDIDAEAVRLSAKLAHINLPESFLFSGPYAKQYAAEWDESSNSPRSIKWASFVSAVDYNKIQPTQQQQYMRHFEELLAIENAKQAQAEAAKALAAAKAEAEQQKQVAQVVAKKAEQVPDDQLRRAHHLVKSRLATQFGELRNAFRKYDTDRSGSISHEEMVAAIQGLELGLPQKAIQRMIDLADYDEDGEVSFAEFARIISADDIIEMKNSLEASATTSTAGVVKADGVGKSVKEKPKVIKNGVTDVEVRKAVTLIREKLTDKYLRLDSAFKKIDVDRSGYLSREEMRFCVMSLNLDSLNKAVIEVVIDLADADGDGQINHYEFVRLLTSQDPLNMPPAVIKKKADKSPLK